jgi:hypothetical protein
VTRLVDLAGIYARVVRRGAVLFGRHWWLGLVFAGYQTAAFLVAVLLAPLGMAGGFIAAIVSAAFASSGLVLLGGVLRHGRATLADVPGSFGVYLGDVLTFGFLLWVLGYVEQAVFPPRALSGLAFEIGIFVLLNAVPEEIYLGGEGGPAMFVGSYEFIGRHWLEWLPLAMVLYAGWHAASDPSLGLAGAVVGGLALAFMLVCRGLLFLELTTSSRRAREFRRRAAG